MLVSPTEAAERAGVSRQAIHAAIRRGELRVIALAPVPGGTAKMLDADAVARWSKLRKRTGKRGRQYGKPTLPSKGKEGRSD